MQRLKRVCTHFSLCQVGWWGLHTGRTRRRTAADLWGTGCCWPVWPMMGMMGWGRKSSTSHSWITQRGCAPFFPSQRAPIPLSSDIDLSCLLRVFTFSFVNLFHSVADSVNVAQHILLKFWACGLQALQHSDPRDEVQKKGSILDKLPLLLWFLG